jgi:hypothetical protein
LFVYDIGVLLYIPSNQTRTAAPMAPVIQPDLSSAESALLHSTKIMDLPNDAAKSTSRGFQIITGTSLEDFKSNKNMTSVSKKAIDYHLNEMKLHALDNLRRPGLDKIHTVTTASTSASSITGRGFQGISYEWGGSDTQPRTTRIGQRSVSTPPFTTPLLLPETSPAGPSNLANRKEDLTTEARFQKVFGISNVKTLHSLECADFPAGSHENRNVSDAKEINPPSPKQSVTTEANEEVAAQTVSTPSRRPSGVLPIQVDGSKEEDLKPAGNPSAEMVVASPSSETESSLTTTESTGSLGSYEDTSDDESDVDLRKQRTIDRIMADFYTMFDRNTGIAQRPVHGQSGHGDQSPTSTGVQCPKRRASQRQSKRRRLDDGDGKEESGDETQKRGKRIQTGNSDEPERRLACPYFKHNPRRYRNVHPCLGPGWNSIHRLK